MKYYTFNRESDNFDDILSDKVIKKLRVKIRWTNTLLIGLADADEKTQGYVVLKYGDDIVKLVNTDFTPVPGKDYTVIRK